MPEGIDQRFLPDLEEFLEDYRMQGRIIPLTTTLKSQELVFRIPSPKSTNAVGKSFFSETVARKSNTSSRPSSITWSDCFRVSSKIRRAVGS
jgi:hypothetical protein